jgi:hypothetical protein
MKTRVLLCYLLVVERSGAESSDHRRYPALFQRRAQKPGGERGCDARGKVRLPADRRQMTFAEWLIHATQRNATARYSKR